MSRPRYEYFEWLFAGKGVWWRGCGQEEFERMEREGWTLLCVFDKFALLRRRKYARKP